MEPISRTIERINELLMAHRELQSFVCIRSRYIYDAKAGLRGSGLLILRIQGIKGLAADHPPLPLYYPWLSVSDVRSEQHDGVHYEISDMDEDQPLWRCRSLSVLAEGRRLCLG